MKKSYQVIGFSMNTFKVWLTTAYKPSHVEGQWITLNDFESAEDFFEYCESERNPVDGISLDFADVEQGNFNFFDGCPSRKDIEAWYDLREFTNEDAFEFAKATAYLNGLYNGDKKHDMWKIAKEAEDKFACTEDSWHEYVSDLIDEYLCQFIGFERSYFDDAYYEKNISYGFTFSEGFVFYN